MKSFIFSVLFVAFMSGNFLGQVLAQPIEKAAEDSKVKNSKSGATSGKEVVVDFGIFRYTKGEVFITSKDGKRKSVKISDKFFDGSVIETSK